MATLPDDALTAEIAVTNSQFLIAVCGMEEAWRAHVTAFADDPSAITVARRGICWGGQRWRDVHEAAWPEHLALNQYFCISGFRPLPDGKAVRRRDHFEVCYCIVADDVGTKVPRAQAERLPEPSWILETSPGNYQWGWILRREDGSLEDDRGRVDALLDGLVERGLAPDGKDPGMRGVTRYVRLPEGWNSKAAYVGTLGRAWRCRMRRWNPEVTVTLEALAGPFGVDLNATRETAADVNSGVWPEDAPVMAWLEDNCIEQKNDSEYLVICPWLEEHSDGDDSGTWLRTLEDGKGEFKCHHGHCQERGFNDFLVATGLRSVHDSWASGWRIQQHLSRQQGGLPPVSTIQGGAPPTDGQSSAPAGEVDLADRAGVEAEGDLVEGDAMAAWRALIEVEGGRGPAGIDAVLARVAEDRLDAVTREMVLRTVRDQTGVGIRALERRARELRREAAQEARLRVGDSAAGGADGVVTAGGAVGGAGEGGDHREVPQTTGQVIAGHCFVTGLNKYYRLSDGALMVPQAFDATWAHLDFVDPRAPEDDLGNPNRVKPTVAFDTNPASRKVAGLGWQPTSERFFTLDGQQLVNTYRPPDLIPRAGNVDPFLWLMEHLIKEPRERQLWLQHMAYTVQRPDQKILWGILGVGKPRIGKSSIVRVMSHIFGGASLVINGENIESGWGDYWAKRKVICIEEVYRPGDRKFWNDIKARIANSDREALNLKGGAIVYQQNLASVYLYSNHEDAVGFDADDEKLLVVAMNEHLPGLEDPVARSAWFSDYYRWLRMGGAAAVYHYLLHEVDTSDFSHGALPLRTEAYYEMARMSQPDYHQRLDDLIENREYPFDRPAVTPDEVAGYVNAVMRQGKREVTRNGVASYLARKGFKRRRPRHWDPEQKTRKRLTFYTREMTPTCEAACAEWYETIGSKPFG